MSSAGREERDKDDQLVEVKGCPSASFETPLSSLSVIASQPRVRGRETHH